MRRLIGFTLVLALAGCASGDTGDTASSGEGGPAVIEVTGIAYPDLVTVPAGRAVRFVNGSGVGHTVTFTTRDGEPFQLDENLPGDGVADFDLEPGTYTYFCAIHPTMSGSLVVEG